MWTGLSRPPHHFTYFPPANRHLDNPRFQVELLVTMARQTYIDTGLHPGRATGNRGNNFAAAFGYPAARAVRPICAVFGLGADVTAVAASTLIVAWPTADTYRAIALGESWWILLPGALGLLASSCFMLCYFTAKGHYSRRLSSWVQFCDILKGAFYAAILTGFIAFLCQSHSPRWTTLGGWLMFVPLILLFRTVARRGLAAAGLWNIRVLIVGDPASTQRTVDILKRYPEFGYVIADVIKPGNLQNLPAYLCWRTLMRGHDARLLIFAFQGCDAPGQPVLEALMRQRVVFALMPEAEGLPVCGLHRMHFFSHDMTMSSVRNNLASPVARSVKLGFDFATAATCLFMLMPLFAIIALLVKQDGGPAFYRHSRLGRNGRPFACLKFRSMVMDGDAMLRDALRLDPVAAAEWDRSRKLTVDPRVTPIGRFLRATSLDELPQLWNVLRLEMSIVGPRPIVPAEVHYYGNDISFYYEARPGLTGLWQISGRAQTTYAKRVQLDTWYVKNWTLLHDILIVLKTVPAVFRRQGAY